MSLISAATNLLTRARFLSDEVIVSRGDYEALKKALQEVYDSPALSTHDISEAGAGGWEVLTCMTCCKSAARKNKSWRQWEVQKAKFLQKHK